MRIRKRLIALILVIAGIIAYKYYKKNHAAKFEVNDEQMYVFENTKGPSEKSSIKSFSKTSWKKYNTGASYGIGILLSDTNSSWLGLVHAFKTFGIPFKIHTNTDSALKHDVVMAYPLISGKAFNRHSLEAMDNYLRNGGTLIGVNVLGGITEDFGITEAVPSRKNFKVKINDNESIFLKEFKDEKELEISLGDSKSFEQTIGTHHYSNPALKPLLVYESGQACMTQYYFKSGGNAFALGIDLGEFVLRSENERGFNAQRSYVNDYEPSLDVLIRLIKNIYTASSQNAVILNTVPENKALTVCITHDIDFTKSIKYMVNYAAMEKEKGVPATYFIQTKYVKDWNDDVFFNKEGVNYLKQVKEMGMDIGSHSVAHSHAYSKFSIGTGDEKYPDYRPFVMGRDSAVGGSVLGELRVSKYLLETMCSNTQVVSFRPGHLSYPFALPQCLEATGFKYSSSVTANNVLTHLPYQLQYNRENDEELNIYEFPVTIEDEEKPRMDLRLDKSLALAKKLSNYGGLMNVLIHTDTLGYKLKYERELIDQLKEQAYFASLTGYADWWKARNSISFYIENNLQTITLTVNTQQPVNEIGFTIPANWQYTGSDTNIEQSQEKLLIHHLKKTLVIEFRKNK